MAQEAVYNKYIETIIISFKSGFEVYHNTRVIKIKDKRTNLLIMVDYVPTLGEVEGRVEIISDDNQIILDDIKGFYIIQNNVFKLLLRDDETTESKRETDG